MASKETTDLLLRQQRQSDAIVQIQKDVFDQSKKIDALDVKVDNLTLEMGYFFVGMKYLGWAITTIVTAIKLWLDYRRH